MRDDEKILVSNGGGCFKSKKLLFVVNVDWFFLSHRLQIAIEARRRGYEVHIATAVTNQLEALREHGLQVHSLALNRSSVGLIGELKVFFQLLWLFRRIRPDVVHLVTIKPVLYGGIAARIVAVKSVIAAISGLGYVFGTANLRAHIVRTIVIVLYRLAMAHKNLRVIFQNRTDRDILIGLGIVKADQSVIIRGSGADLLKYRSVPEVPGTPVVVMAARLLLDKGVAEFVAAAAILNAKGVKAFFRLVGDPDPDNPMSVPVAQLEAWRAEGLVEMMGFRTDIPELFATSHIVVLPSYYLEGLPKVLVEAAACGRSTVTTNEPGCRDAIDPEVTGLLVPSRDPVKLADAIQRLIEDPELRRRMGTAGRALAEREFAIETIVAAHLKIYQELGQQP